MPVLSSYVGDHAALPRMSANADFSTLLKCLASAKKSIELLRPSAPRQTSALELLVVYCIRILLAYLCALYYGMLILSFAHGACPTPPAKYREPRTSTVSSICLTWRSAVCTSCCVRIPCTLSVPTGEEQWSGSGVTLRYYFQYSRNGAIFLMNN